MAATQDKPTPADFTDTDIVKFVPKLGLQEIDSDKTVDALLSGKFGPCVVMFYADWCTHCRNMADAYTVAAAAARIPFVKVSGNKAPVSSQKHGVAGYPTIFGVANVGGLPRRFASARTSESLLLFADALQPLEAMAPTLAPEAPAAPAAPVAPMASPAALAPVALAPLAPTVPAIMEIPPSLTSSSAPLIVEIST